MVKKIAILLKSLKFSDYNVQTQTMIIRQLLKNGIKYGHFTLPENEITVSIHITDNTIAVEVMNPVDAEGAKNLSELDKTIQFIKGYQDPFEAFMILHKEAVKGKYHNGSNDLDLARIAYQGNVALDFIISEDNTLIQSAVRKLEGSNRVETLIQQKALINKSSQDGRFFYQSDSE